MNISPLDTNIMPSYELRHWLEMLKERLKKEEQEQEKLAKRK